MLSPRFFLTEAKLLSFHSDIMSSVKKRVQSKSAPAKDEQREDEWASSCDLGLGDCMREEEPEEE